MSLSPHERLSEVLTLGEAIDFLMIRMWRSIKNSPYQARYEWLHSAKGPNGEVLRQREAGIRCRDDDGRERVEKRTNCDYLESAEIYDPVKELEFILVGDAQAIVFSSAPDFFSAHTFSLDDGSAMVLPDARQERIGQHIGEHEIEGTNCSGYRVVDDGRYTLEYWVSTGLEEVLRLTISTESKKSEYRLFDIRIINPDQSIFALPERSQRHLV